MRIAPRRDAYALLLALSLASPGLAQSPDTPRGAAAGPAPAAADNPLAGPRVGGDSGSRTLVEHAYDGKVRRLEVPPEEAALERLGLDEPTRQAVGRILAERAAIVDRVVIENVPMLLEYRTAAEAGDRAESVRVLGEFLGKLDPLTKRGTLLDELAGVLSVGPRHEFEALVGEYREALREEARREAVERGERFRPRAYGVRENLLTLGQEIRRSYERQVTGRIAEFDKVLAELALEPEREARVRALVTEFGQRTRLNPTEAQRRELFAAILKELTPEQAGRLLRVALDRR